MVNELLKHPYYSALLRILSYGIWTIGAYSLPVAVDRFFISPLLVKKLGEEIFGDFIWLISIVLIFVMTINSGYGNTLLRKYNNKECGFSRNLVGTTFYLSLGTAVPVFALVGLITFYFNGQQNLANYYLLLFSYGIAQCLLWIFLTYSRIRRYFKFVFILKVVEAIGLLSMRFFVEEYELWLVASFYLLSTNLAIIVAVWFYWFNDRILAFKWNAGASKEVIITAPGFAAASFVEYLTTYAPRIVLGILSESSSVTQFFVLTSTASLFIFPVSMGATLVLSLLAGRDKFVNNTCEGFIYLSLVLLVSIGVCVLSYFIGSKFISYLYPEISDQVTGLYDWVAFANLFYTASLLLRSVLIRYSPVRIIVMLPTFGLVLTVISLLILVPLYGVKGAVIALMIYAVINSLLTVFFYLKFINENKQLV